MRLIKTMLESKNVFPDKITNEWINQMPRRKLTSEEKKLPYAKYYHKDIAPIPQSDLDIVNDGPIQSRDALPITKRHALLELGYLKTETGYCLMPDGTGFASTKVFMPNVTPQMLDWWFNWHPLHSLRYVIWCPIAHVGISAETPEAHKDSSGIDLKKRNYGKSHFPVEGFDLKSAQRIRIRFYDPKQLGIDISKFEDTNVSNLFAAAVTREIGSFSIPINVFMHFVRKVDGGVEYRSRYWLGWTINKQGELKKSIFPFSRKFMLSITRNNCIHSLTEYNNLASFLPSLYEEEQGRID